MKISREIKKEEAIKRMEALRLFAPCVKVFKDRNEVQLTEQNGGLYEFSADAELNAKTALVRCTGYPKEFKIRPIQVYTDKECFTKDCQTKISVNLKEVQLF